MPIRQDERFDFLPTLVQGANDIRRKIGFLEITQILFDVFYAIKASSQDPAAKRNTDNREKTLPACSDENGVWILPAKSRMMGHPSQSNFCQGEAVLVRNGLDLIHGLKVFVAEVPGAIRFTLPFFGIKSRTLFYSAISCESSSKETATEWVVGIESEAVVTQTWQKFCFHGSIERIIDTLVYAWFDPTMRDTNFADLGDFP